MQSYYITPTIFGFFRPDKLVSYLYSCLHNDQPAYVEWLDEAACAEITGLYRVLDDFCEASGYDKSQITITTGNLKEQHEHYKIKYNYTYWIDCVKVQKHMHQIDVGQNVIKHFGSFIGRSSWSRLWIASELFTKYKHQTLQTFHSHLQCNYCIDSTSGIFDTLGLEDLNQCGYNDLTNIAELLKHCPLKIQDEKYSYPLHYPDNLNIINFYKDIFLDIVTECYVDGSVFAITEKTWRPIACKRPFILMSTLNTLENLRSLGFKTFNQWWDEGYDDYEGHQRVEQLLKVIDTVSQWDIVQCNQYLNEMKPILEHNYKLLEKLKISDFEKDYI